MLLYVGLYSASNRIHPTFSYIMSFSYIYIYIYVTSLHCRHFLYEMDIWLKTRSCRKRKTGQSELDLCKLYVFSYTNNVYIEKNLKYTVTSSSSPEDNIKSPDVTYYKKISRAHRMIFTLILR